MAHLTTIERIQQVCAAGTIRLKRQKYGDGTHLLWTWEVAAQQAVLVLEAVALYSVTKKSQVELGLSYWKERGDGRNGPSVPTSPALLDLRDEYYQRMRVLKKEVV